MNIMINYILEVNIMADKELEQKLEEYMDLKKWIEEYNKEQLQKGLDLGGRIISDIIKTFPYEIGTLSIDWENNYAKQELVLKLGVPFDNNLSIHGEVIDYIVERYPDTSKHYLGVQLAECVPFNRLNSFMSKLSEKGDSE